MKKNIAASTVLFGFFALSLTAQAATLSIDYQCIFPLLEEQPLAVRIDADIPASIATGVATAPFSITAEAVVSATSWNGLTFVGSSTLQGNVIASAQLLLPGDVKLDLAVPMALTETTLPSSRQDFITRASGVTPSLVFPQPGMALIRVGNVLLKLSPKDIAGELTGIGEFESECTALAGQDTVLQRITVTEHGTAPAHPYRVAGSLTLARSRAASALSGRLVLTPNSGDDISAATLAIDAVQATLRSGALFNILSAEATIAFENSDAISASRSASGLQLSANIGATMPLIEARLFGFPIGNIGGPDCRLSRPATLALNSPDFTVEDGGSAAGDIVLPASSGCRSDLLVDALLRSSDNPLVVTLLPDSTL